MYTTNFTMKPEDPTPRSAVIEGKLKKEYVHLGKIYDIK